MAKDFRDYTILVPMMAEPHFTLMVDALNKSGQVCVLLTDL